MSNSKKASSSRSRPNSDCQPIDFKTGLIKSGIQPDHLESLSPIGLTGELVVTDTNEKIVDKLMEKWMSVDTSSVDLRSRHPVGDTIIQNLSDDLSSMMITDPVEFNIEDTMYQQDTSVLVNFNITLAGVMKICKEWKLINVVEVIETLEPDETDLETVTWLSSLTLEDLVQLNKVIGHSITNLKQSKLQSNPPKRFSGPNIPISREILRGLFIKVKTKEGNEKIVKLEKIPWWSEDLFEYLKKHVNLSILFNVETINSGICSEFLYVFACHIKSYPISRNNCYDFKQSKINLAEFVRQVWNQ